MCRVTALCWAQAFNLWVLDPPAASRSSPAESLLVGRSDGSLCWLQVEMHELDLRVKSTELIHCYRKEGKGDSLFSGQFSHFVNVLFDRHRLSPQENFMERLSPD